jgi:hypothetical protein
MGEQQAQGRQVVKSKLILKLVALGGMMLALFALLASAAKPGVVSATANPLPPLLSCPNVDGSSDNKVRSTDILIVSQHYGWSYGQPGYSSLYDPYSPYNSTNPSGTGRITSVDILSVAQKYNQTCPLVDTQIAEATRAISEPLYSDILCDPTFATRVNCGGDPQFLTEDPAFLASKGYRRGSTDVPGQGIHYVNYNLWDGVFNPVRPEGLVYKATGPEDPGVYSGSCTDGVDNSAADPIHGGDGLIDGADPDCQVYRLVAQLYYGDGDVIGWGSNASLNVRAVNTDALPCTVSLQEPPGVGCSWNGAFDGWHWHANLCTWAIGTPSAFALPGQASQANCAAAASAAGHPCTAFYPAVGWDCTWKAQVGWMGHLWNWLPNANYTNAVNQQGLTCQVAYCSTGEANGRFADCFPDTNGWNAYNCPQ